MKTIGKGQPFSTILAFLLNVFVHARTGLNLARQSVETLTVMKNYILFSLLTVIAGSCTFYDVEPRYDQREKFLGYYDVEEYSNTYRDYTYYEIRITRSRHDREVYLNNFYAADLRVYAVISFNDLRIPYQVVDGYEIEGSGTLYGDQLSLSYRVKDLYDYNTSNYCETVAWR